jgi:hypothetical protein
MDSGNNFRSGFNCHVDIAELVSKKADVSATHRTSLLPNFTHPAWISTPVFELPTVTDTYSKPGESI